jgi:hypothetical protein
MTVPRRDFMKLFGISLGSLLLARCQRKDTTPTQYISCYTVVPITSPLHTPTPMSLSARDHLRLCWLRFGELAQVTQDAASKGDGSGEDDPLGDRMIAEHRKALDELVSGGDLIAPVADLVHEAYCAAVYHVWRSNAPITCYEPMVVDYAPASADNLVHQSQILDQISEGGTIDPETLARARAALEHDLAFYTLTDVEIQELYVRILKEYWNDGKGSVPSFDAVELTLTAEVKAAARFLLDLLIGK